jgi:fatty-acyl-CoA synthase
MTHPEVVTVRVVGARGAAGDVAVGFVKLTAGGVSTEDDLLDFCRGRLAPFKVPTRVELVDEFPVTAGTNGTKIKNEELRRRAAELIGAGG